MLHVVPPRDLLFRETQENFENLLHAYLEQKKTIEVVNGPWDFAPIYDILGYMEQQYPLFTSLRENINCPVDYTIMAIGFSDLPSGTPAFPHIDDHPIDGSFKRYHLPLRLTESSRINVQSPGDTSFSEYEWQLGKWMWFEGIQHKHYPMNRDPDGMSRIILIMDIQEGKVLDSQIEWYYNTVKSLGWLGKKDFKPLLEKYTSERRNYEKNYAVNSVF